MTKLNSVIIGASGYTGAELIRLLLNHPNVNISALIANSNAGQDIEVIYPHLANFNLPRLQKLEEVDLAQFDVAFCCLPHTTSQEIIAQIVASNINPNLKIIDLSADFRLDVDVYEAWYSQHLAKDLQSSATYGLSEIYKDQIARSNLIACPGCYPTSVLLPLIPLLQNKLISEQGIIADSKSGITGAGRMSKVANLFSEVNESVKAYGIGSHRHTGEIEQELSNAANQNIQIDFTPHLLPINRGIISTIYVDINDGFSADDLRNCLETKYNDEYFVNICDAVQISDVRATNFCNISVNKARTQNKAIIVSVIDNLCKGASGQAVQNMNIAFGFDERLGLAIAPLFP